jgi:hypothetical protein
MVRHPFLRGCSRAMRTSPAQRNRCRNVADNFAVTAAVIPLFPPLFFRQNTSCFKRLSRFQKKSEAAEQRSRGNLRVSGHPPYGRLSAGQTNVLNDGRLFSPYGSEVEEDCLVLALHDYVETVKRRVAGTLAARQQGPRAAASSIDDNSGSRAAAATSQTMPSRRKPATASASRPSQSASTSAVCSPSSGADLTSVGTPSKRTGQVGIVILRSP